MKKQHAVSGLKVPTTRIQTVYAPRYKKHEEVVPTARRCRGGFRPGPTSFEYHGDGPEPFDNAFAFRCVRTLEQRSHSRSEERRVGKECRSRWCIGR